MYCSNCGQVASGNFCSACGSALNAPAPILAEIVPIDWRTEVRYVRLITVAEVRERIAAAGRRHRKQMTGEEFLATFDALVPTGVKLEKLIGLVQPLYAKMGLKTGKSSRLQLALPTGAVLVGVLCAMAEHGNELTHVEQSDEGCALHAILPSSIWSLAGDLIVTVRRVQGGTLVEANTHIAGTWYDWGHSQRLLDALFQGIPAFAA